MAARLLRKVVSFQRKAFRSYCFKSVKNIIREEVLEGEHKNINVRGWVKSVRDHKGVIFIDLNDGSSVENLQVVANKETIPEQLEFGSAAVVKGMLVRSNAKGQNVELKASSVEVTGACDISTYPIKPKTRYSLEYLRQFPHLRSRTNTFGSLLRIRSAAAAGIDKFFQENEFLKIHTPIITSNDCEGAGELFQVRPQLSGESNSKEDLFFNVPGYLTVSGQLHLEIMCCSHGKVYTFNPAFRTESSRSRRHLSEFYMVEAEIPYTERLEDITKVMESLVQFMVNYIYDSCSEDVEFFNKFVKKRHKETVGKAIQGSFQILPYSDAITILKSCKEDFQFQPKWGNDLQTEHEKYIVKHCGVRPVFVVDYPACIKPFYMRVNDSPPETVAGVDLLVPGVGELIGGGLREDRVDLLQATLDAQGMKEDYEWYLDLRRYGNIPHGGFGLGFERFLLYLLGLENVRDVIPFPRYSSSCML